MVDIDYERALKYPARGEGAPERILIGAAPMAVVGLLTLVAGFLGLFVGGAVFLGLLVGVPLGLLVLTVWLGYWIRVARATLAGREEPPGFGPPVELFREGAWASAIHLAYWTPGLAAGAAGLVGLVALAVLPSLTGSPDLFAGAFLVSMLAVMISAVLLPVAAGLYATAVWYAMPISLCQYARTGSVRSALSREALGRTGLDTDYATAWGILSTVTLLPALMAGVGSYMFFGLVLMPVLPFLLFYTGTAAIHVVTELYAEKLGLDGAGSEAPGSASPRDRWNRVEASGE